MKITVFSSGSEGNCIFIEENQSSILVDAGISRFSIVANLKQMGKPAGEIEGIFITHEHYDHTRGLKTLSKNEKLPVYASEGTIDKLKQYVPNCEYRPIYLETKLNGFTIKNIPLPHDAAEPLGFVIEGRNSRLMIVTDLGFVTERVVKEISNCNVVIFESNHDLQMLNTGHYPRHLKERILSRWGHLSNNQCSAALNQGKWTGLELVVLAHLSKENNRPEIALHEASRAIDGKTKLMVADRREVTGPFEI